eukprot:6175317-Pleurochrysis_carterae.AAC.4
MIWIWRAPRAVHIFHEGTDCIEHRYSDAERQLEINQIYSSATTVQAIANSDTANWYLSSPLAQALLKKEIRC